MSKLNRSKLRDHSKSQLNKINITLSGEHFKFNLFQELIIGEDEFLNDNLKTQPSYYGLLLVLHKKLLTSFEELKTERKRIYGKLFFKAKRETLNNRPLSDDLAKCWVEKHKEFIFISRQCIKAKDNADTIYACVKAFEQRKDLMQTLASNRRKEN